MDEIIKMLVKQLDEKGLAEDEISSCISSLWEIFTIFQVKSCQDINRQMQAMGWHDFRLDEHSFKMVSSAFTQ
jgi:hypothetical protein